MAQSKFTLHKYVKANLDSRDWDNFRLVLLIKSYGDERYSKDLGKKIHRGQEGRILKTARVNDTLTDRGRGFADKASLLRRLVAGGHA
ncbi:MAG: hypothetical protein WCA15_00130 [Candidatus Acidiferrales bacterium]